MAFKMSAIILLALIASISMVIATHETSDSELLNLISKVEDEKSLYLFGGLSVEKSKTPKSLFVHSNEYSEENVLDRVIRYLRTHELKFNMPKDNVQVEEARTSKLKKIVLPLILALKLKAAIILPVILTVLAMISFKGLAAGTLALLFSGATFFKDSLGKKQGGVTTAYITGNPVSAELVHSDWNRNGQVGAQEMAYNYHTLPQNY